MERNGANTSPDSKFVPTAEMMEDIMKLLQHSFCNLMEGKDIEETLKLREADLLSFGVEITQRFIDNFERIKIGSIQLMEFTNEEYLYSLPNAADEVHRTMEASRKGLRMVIPRLETIIANEPGEASGQNDQESGAQSDSESSDIVKIMLEVLQNFETGLLNSTHEALEDIKKAIGDSLDCLSSEKKVEETCELRETNPLTFKAGIILHYLSNMLTIERCVLKIEELCNNKEVLYKLPYAEDQLHRDMDSATKGLEKTVDLLSAMKKDLGKAPVSSAEASTSDREPLR